MGLFSKNKAEGGILDVIRCDEPDYLVWKWSPAGVPSRRENAIRWGSTLRVKQGEVAVFVYRQNDGKEMDYFEGPLDTTLKTANFPVLSGILGSVFGGETPFQAEIYFINLAGNVRLPFFVPQFDVSDPRFLDYAVPVTVKGQLLFNITDYKSFISLHRMMQFDMDDFAEEVRASVVRYTKSVVTNAPSKGQIPLLQIERHIDEVTTLVEERLRSVLADDFGVNLKRLDLSEIALDKDSEGYADLYEVTTAQMTELTRARTEDTVERLRMGREVEFKRQNLGAETDYFAAHRLNQQTEVAKIAAESLGEMGGGMGGGDGLNPAGMMAGMMLGGAVGSNMAGMMNGMMGGMQGTMAPQTAQTPPPLTMTMYYVAVNGQQTGPYALEVIRQMIADGRIVRETLVWKQGMPAWEQAGAVTELAPCFVPVSPVPPVPPVPPVVPPQK